MRYSHERIRSLYLALFGRTLVSTGMIMISEPVDIDRQRSGMNMGATNQVGEREPFVLAHAQVIMPVGEPLEDASVMVDANGRIESVAPSRLTAVPEGYHMIDATGKTVLPGLINVHTHLFSEGRPLNPKLATPKGQRMVASFAHSPIGKLWIANKVRANALTLLQSGVTTIRTLGDVGYEVVALRERVESGETLGPRILASGPMLAIPEGHGAPLVALTASTVDEAKTIVRENIDHGVTAIKIAATGGVTDSQVLGEAGSPQMSVEQMQAICEAAHEAGLIVAAHAQSHEGVRRALVAGVDTIEHGSALDDELIDLFLNNPRSLRGWSALVPTLSAGLPMKELDQSTLGLTDVQMSNGATVVEGMLEGAKQAYQAGIVVGVGTDSAMTFVPQYATWRELDLLVKYVGITPHTAIEAATAVNARILGVDGETGSIRPGLSADLLVVEGDPLVDLKALEHPAMVVMAGRPIFRPEPKRFKDLDSMLNRVYAR